MSSKMFFEASLWIHKTIVHDMTLRDVNRPVKKENKEAKLTDRSIVRQIEWLACIVSGGWKHLRVGQSNVKVFVFFENVVVDHLNVYLSKCSDSGANRTKDNRKERKRIKRVFEDEWIKIMGATVQLMDATRRVTGKLKSEKRAKNNSEHFCTE